MDVKKILLILMLIAVGIFAMFALALAGLGEKTGSGQMAKATGGGGCTANGTISVSYVPQEYMQWVADASTSYLKGDSLALIAVIEEESSWDPNSTYKGHATGLGQFEPGTAKSMPEFKGGQDAAGNTWPVGIVYDPSTGHPDDARFDAKRSIYAAAYYLGQGMQKQNWDLFNAYAINYHTYGNDGSAKGAAISAATQVMNYYNKLKATVSVACASANGGSIVSIAHQQLGLAESPPNSDSGSNIQKFLGTATSEKWCADFVSWVYWQANTPFTGGLEPSGWRIPGADNVYAYIKAHGTAVDRSPSGNNPPPQEGDVIYFNFSGQDHVGIVESVAGNSLTYISGNTTANNVAEATVNYQTNTNVIGWGRLK